MDKKHAEFLTRQRAALKAEATAITEAADKDNGGVLSAEQEARFKAIEGDVAHIDAELAAGQRLAETPEQVEKRVRGEIADITAACALAGKPEKAAEFIKAETPLAEVVSKLQAEKAAGGQELNPRSGGKSGGSADAASWDKIVARTNDRIGAKR